MSPIRYSLSLLSAGCLPLLSHVSPMADAVSLGLRARRSASAPLGYNSETQTPPGPSIPHPRCAVQSGKVQVKLALLLSGGQPRDFCVSPEITVLNLKNMLARLMYPVTPFHIHIFYPNGDGVKKVDLDEVNPDLADDVTLRRIIEKYELPTHGPVCLGYLVSSRSKTFAQFRWYLRTLGDTQLAHNPESETYNDYSPESKASRRRDVYRLLDDANHWTEDELEEVFTDEDLMYIAMGHYRMWEEFSRYAYDCASDSEDEDSIPRPPIECNKEGKRYAQLLRDLFGNKRLALRVMESLSHAAIKRRGLGIDTKESGWECNPGLRRYYENLSLELQEDTEVIAAYNAALGTGCGETEGGDDDAGSREAAPRARKEPHHASTVTDSTEEDTSACEEPQLASTDSTDDFEK